MDMEYRVEDLEVVFWGVKGLSYPGLMSAITVHTAGVVFQGIIRPIDLAIPLLRPVLCNFQGYN